MAITVSAVTASTFPTSRTALVIGLPAAGVGDLLVVNLGVRNVATYTTPSGWTQVGTANAAAVGQLAIFTKVADGTEGGTVTFTSSVGNVGAAQCRTVSGADTATAVAVATANSGGTPGTTANPPNLTPAWGTANTLWLAYMATAASGATTSAGPTGYADFAFTNVAAGGSSGGAGSAYKVANAASEDPGSFTSTADRWWMAATVAVKPATTGGGTVTGTGSLTAASPVLAGSGSLTLAGSGGLSASAPVVVGAGTLLVAGSAALTAGTAALDGSGALRLTGAGTLAADTPTLAGSGALGVTGTGALAAAASSLDGSGTVIEPAPDTVTGTGALSATGPTLAGTGAVTVVIGGALVAASPSLGGLGTLRLVGAATLTAQAASLIGSGLVVDPGQFRDITLTVGPGSSRGFTAAGTSRGLTATASGSRSLTAAGSSRGLAAAGSSRTLTAEPQE